MLNYALIREIYLDERKIGKIDVWVLLHDIVIQRTEMIFKFQVQHT
jgi:hypothetical protein